MRVFVWILCLVPSLAVAGGAPADGINWFTIGDPHSLAMAWFMLNFFSTREIKCFNIIFYWNRFSCSCCITNCSINNDSA